MELGERVRRLRRARGLTGSELARRAGISASAVRMLESGQRSRVSIDVASGLARALGLSVDALLAGEIAGVEAAARRAHALELLEGARDEVAREPVDVGPEAMVPDQGAVPADRSTWDSREVATMRTPIPPVWLAGRAPQSCFVVTVEAGGVAAKGIVPGTRVLFSREGELVDGDVVLVFLFDRVRLGVYRARGERVELAGDPGQGDDVDEAWPDDHYEVVGHYLGHWVMGQSKRDS